MSLHRFIVTLICKHKFRLHGAHRGASIIAEQLAGDASISFKGYLGSNIVKFFDYTLASVGVKPIELDYFNYEMVEVKQGAHAGYYPGNTPFI